MNAPKMILFDYGQTIGNEHEFDLAAGFRALLDRAQYVPADLTIERILEEDYAFNLAVGRYVIENPSDYLLEFRNEQCANSLLEGLGVKLGLPGADIDRIFWNAAAPAVPCEGIAQLLDFLHTRSIRTGVISNISYCGEVLSERINQLVPDNHFEFVMASSDYVFRKPQRRLFDIALKKAGLCADEVWYCGDNAVCDVGGAQSAGIFPVWYRGAVRFLTEPKNEPYLAIDSWNELIDHLEKML